MDWNDPLTEENLKMLQAQIERTPSLYKIWKTIPNDRRPEFLEAVYLRGLLQIMRQQKQQKKDEQRKQVEEKKSV